MQYQTIVGKTNEYLLNASAGLAKWLDKYLPQRADRWEKFVFSKLSDSQRNFVYQNGWSKLEELDLAALLRIADRNFYIISQKYFLSYSEKDCLEKMFGIRNRWAHISTGPIQYSQIISDLETIKFFFGQVEIDRQLVNEFSLFIDAIKNEGITNEPVSVKKEKPALQQNIDIPKEITTNSIVHLTNDSSKRGMVQAVSKIGDTQKYQVFIDGAVKTYYAGQIELELQPHNKENTGIDDLLRIFTARQINPPSSTSLYSLNSSRIDFVPYQFRPVLKLIKSETPRLLIADSVGVGKTIEAGLILKEMQARTPLETVIIICPKPLVAERKWEREMKEKFGEEFLPADSSILRQIIKDYARDGAWGDRYRRLIVPYSILTDELLNGINGRNSHTGLKNMNPVPSFDMLIVDEAHHIRNSSTQAHNVVRFFCEHTNSVLFLTATPIQLGNQDLFTLLNLLFPDVVIDGASFNAMAQPNEYINKAVQLLRSGMGHEGEALDALKEAVTTEWGRNVIAPNPVYSKIIGSLTATGISREQRIGIINEVESLHSFSQMINRTRRQDIEDFCIRRAHTLQSEFTPKQKELHDTLLDFERTALSELHGNVSAKFLMSTISRQASSCLFGLAPFIRGMVTKRLSELFDECDEEIESIDENFDQIGEMAKQVVLLAENLPAEDPKFDQLAKILQERQKPEGGKTIVFSTFRHTLNYLQHRIKSETNIRVAQVNGSVPDDERFNLRERFSLPKDDPNALDVMLFSEVGSEGLDYQFCNAIINYDLPWNPMRIEQRIGRIDRRGQKSEVVYIYNCITKGTIDADIHDRCYQRIDIFEKSIGECSEILGNIEESIKNIVFDSNLTPKERAFKLDRMMDIEEARIKEDRRLEEESKEIFGVDISNFTDDIEKADNPYISPNSIKRLVEGYFEERLGNNGIEDKKLKLTREQKSLLLDDYHSLAGKSLDDKIWEEYLKSPKMNCPITFTQDEAKEKRKNIFITPAHPLVQQASKYFSARNNMYTALVVNGNDIPAGKYPFSIYAWEYKGLRPRIEFISVCGDKNLNNELFRLLQEAITTDTDFEQYSPIWDAQEEHHLLLWQQELERYKAEVKSNCDFKIQSLAKSLEARKLIAERQLAGVEDARIELMRRTQIERLENDFAIKKSKIENDAKTVDIHTTLIVNGVLEVRGE